jgi:hypothetical protein
MADVTVDNWSDLVSNLTNLAEDSTIYLGADIDLNDVPEARTGITEQIKCKNYNIILDGQDHEISNLYCGELNKAVFSGYSTAKFTIKNIKFKKVRLDGRSGISPSLLTNCQLQDSEVTAMVSGGAWIFASGVKPERCGIDVTGDNNTTYSTGDNEHKFCNITLRGYFDKVSIILYNSWLGGDFTVTNTVISNGLRLASSYIGLVNAEIHLAATAPYVSNAKSLVINSDKLKDLNGDPISVPSPAIGATTAEIFQPSELRRLGFPSR